MKASFSAFAGLALLVVVLIVAASTLFTVDQTQQALVLRFGEARTVVKEPGLHFKTPFIENVVYLDNRILDVESAKQEVLANDSNRLEVDSFLRYRIVDALKFYQSVGTPRNADSQLGNVLNSAVRQVLGEATQQEIVREKRAQLMVRIRGLVNAEAQKFGVAIMDVRIRRADLPRQISEKVFSRMQAERQREAAEFRAQGSEQAQRITAKADRDVVVLRATAQQEADKVRGQGEADRSRIFADAYGKDPEFFAFYRSMQAYETGLKSHDTRIVMSPNSDFFRFFGRAKEPDAKPAK